MGSRLHLQNLLVVEEYIEGWLFRGLCFGGSGVELYLVFSLCELNCLNHILAVLPWVQLQTFGCHFVGVLRAVPDHHFFCALPWQKVLEFMLLLVLRKFGFFEISIHDFVVFPINVRIVFIRFAVWSAISKKNTSFWAGVQQTPMSSVRAFHSKLWPLSKNHSSEALPWHSVLRWNRHPDLHLLKAFDHSHSIRILVKTSLHTSRPSAWWS